MSVHEAKPNDVYADATGKLWRVVSVCGEPTVTVQEIETTTPESPVRKSGGVSGYMWHGFKRILTPPEPKKPPHDTREWVRHYDSQGYCDNPGRGY